MSIDTKFADMNEIQRDRWLAWANSHDWGCATGASYSDENKLVTYGQAHDGKQWFAERAEHSTPRDLRNWAGY